MIATTIAASNGRNKNELEEKAPRVLHLVSSGGLYGAEQVILNLARSKNTITYIGALCDVHGGNREVIDEGEKIGVRTVVFDSSRRIDLTPVLQVKRFLKIREIDILHTHGYKSDIVGFLAASLAKVHWVATNHVWHPLSWKMRLYESLDAFVLRYARRVVAVSRAIREDLVSTNVPPAKVRVIGNGIDIERFQKSRSSATLKAVLGIRECDSVVTIVGRLSPEKGHKIFLEAARRVASDNKNVTFLIVGDGPMAQELRAEAARLDLQGRVIFTGFRKDMPEVYAITDLMVNASSIEGLPVTILEAMASRVPVIATCIGGIPDVIIDDETGMLIPSQDADALKTQMESLIDDRDKRRRLTAAAFRFVTVNHSFERMCDAYRQVYAEVMGDGARGYS